MNNQLPASTALKSVASSSSKARGSSSYSLKTTLRQLVFTFSLVVLFACNRAETPQVDEPPPVALNVLAVSASDSQVLLKWEGGGDANLAGYNVYSSLSQEVSITGEPLNPELLNATSYLDSGLDNGVTYYYAVTALAVSGHVFASSQVVSATPEASEELTPPPVEQAVMSFTLINADTGAAVTGFDPMPDGTTLKLDELETTNLTIRANTDPTEVGSVRFSLDSSYQTQNIAPYLLGSSGEGNTYTWTPSAGNYTLSATPYSGPDARGKAGRALTITFEVTGAADASSTRVSIQDEKWLLNGQLTHPGTRAEGMLLNSRMVNATFDDANADTISNWRYPDGSPYNPNRQTSEFIAALPSYAAHGLNAVTLNLQGGGPKAKHFSSHPWHNSAFRADGSLKEAYLERLDKVIRALDKNGMVAIVGFFYFGQDERLRDEAAVVRAVDNATDWLLSQGYGNVIVEVNNEADLRYDHAILKGNSVHELIKRVQARSKGKLLVSTSFKGGSIPSAAVLEQSDFILLHGNSQTPSSIRAMVDTVRGKLASAKPIVFNEDSTRLENFEAAVNSGASWGYYDQGANNYLDGFQSPPTNWSINTTAKRAFFDKVKTLTSR